MSHNRSVGLWGENTAIHYLAENGYSIVAQNYRSRYGEIDIVAKKKSSLFFFEVKTRTSDKYGFPIEAVNTRKLDKMTHCAETFVLQNNYEKYTLVLGVISILINGDDKKIVLYFNDI